MEVMKSDSKMAEYLFDAYRNFDKLFSNTKVDYD